MSNSFAKPGGFVSGLPSVPCAAEADEFCVSLCDLLLSVPSHKDLAALLVGVLDVVDVSCIDRLYVGSYLCPAYFGTACFDVLDTALEWAAEHGCAVTLVIPPVSETDLDAYLVIPHIRRVLGQWGGRGPGHIDELSVNDLGMARLCSRLEEVTSGSVSIALGRLFDKAPRDPRYRDAFAAVRLVDVEEHLAAACLGPSAPFVWTVEIEPTNDVLELAAVHGGGAASAPVVAVHEPYACLTMGRVCEFASIGKPLHHMFRPGAPCSRTCSRACVRYSLHDDVKLLRVGKGVYARHGSLVSKAETSDSSTAPCSSATPHGSAAPRLRRVFWPVDAVLAALEPERSPRS